MFGAIRRKDTKRLVWSYATLPFYLCCSCGQEDVQQMRLR